MRPDQPPSWLAEVQRSPRSIPADATRPAPPLFDGEHRPIASRDGWDDRRKQIGDRWREFLGGPIPLSEDATLEVLDEDRPEGVVRRRVRYESEPGLKVEGYLLRPEGEGSGRPGAVVLHSTQDYTIRQPAGLEGPADVHIGLHLARRGYVAFCPKCFVWDYARPGRRDWPLEAVDWLRRRHPAVKGMAKMLADARRAVDLLAKQPDVDPRRIGAIGHSLGAKEALYLSAFDDRVRAAVASEGGIGLTYSNWDAPWYLGEEIKRPGFALDHGQILALTAPRAMLIVGGDSADGDRSWPYIEETLPVWKLAGAPEAVGLLNHRKGHAFPKEAQEKSYEWLDWFLRAGA